MFRVGTRRFFIAGVLLFLFTASSALGASGRRRAARGAAHHAKHVRRGAAHHPKHARKRPDRRRRKRGTFVRPNEQSRAEVASAAVLLGSSAVESQFDSLPAGEGEAFRLKGSLTGLADVAHLYISARNTAKTVVMGVYTSTDGHPGLLLSAGSAAASAAGTWTSVSITPVELVAGRVYWLAILGEGGTLRYRDRQQGPCPSETSGQTSLGALPAFWRQGTVYGDCPASAYLTAGDPPSPPSPTEPVAPAPPLETPPSGTSASEEAGSATPPPPADISLPTIAGNATEGQELASSSGAWSNSPTSYAYQWQDCNSSGERCSSITGAASSTFRLRAVDVGHTVRVLVAASNAGGSSQVSSAASAVVSAAESPSLVVGSAAVQSGEDTSSEGSAEAFEYTASASGTVHSLSLYVDSLNSAPSIVVGLYNSVSGNPATLLTSAVIASPAGGAWNAVEVPAATVHSGSVYWLAALAPTGTLAMRDLASGGGPTESSASGSLSALPSSWAKGASWANSPASFYASTSTVGSPPPAPVNTGSPTIAGSAVEGQTLTASSGSWSGSPTSYAYEWEDCNALGEGCSNIGGATSSTYQLMSGDVGHTVKVVVTATNAGGSGKASSAATVPVLPQLIAPVNTGSPTVSGSAVEGQTLSASSGSWSGSPTSYAYQWEDCNSAGEGCSSIGGATGTSYKLLAGDVGSRLRVMVTASNGAGSGLPASSAPTAVVTAPPPPPANTGPPVVSGSAVEGQTLSATAGSWSGSGISYGYQWEDCNTSGEGCSSIGGATGTSYKLASTDVGFTLRVVVTAANTGGSAKAASAATAVVALAAPVNTALPVVSGSAAEGQTLSASSGSWTGSPTSYTYAWEDCNGSGEGCANITTATTSTYKLASTDVGHTLRVVVTATNSGGSAKATSAATATVTSEGSTPENCFADPEGCGYPGPGTAGVANCSSLAKSSSGLTVTKSETIENTDITGYVTIDASKVTMKHDCVVINGGENYDATAVGLAQGADDFTITESTIAGTNRSSGSVGEGLRNNYNNPGAVATDDRLEYVGTPFHQGWTVENTYAISNGEEHAAEAGVEHQEDWWISDSTILANHDTLLNPSKQTAVVFAQGGSSSCSNKETITNSLLAGGGYMLYFCAHTSNAGSSSIDIKDDRFARMVCAKTIISDLEGRGGHECSGEPSERISYFDAGEGSGGFYPRGGFFGVVDEGEGLYNKGAGWEGNYWDNNLEAQPEQSND